jgi:hypothetical protein
MPTSVIYEQRIDVLSVSVAGLTIDDGARRLLHVITGPPRSGESR